MADRLDEYAAFAEELARGGSFTGALLTRTHEPDEPNWTPRIAGELVLEGEHKRATLALIKADPFDPAKSSHQFYHYAAIPAGYGWCVTTYQGNRTPLPSFVQGLRGCAKRHPPEGECPGKVKR